MAGDSVSTIVLHIAKAVGEVIKHALQYIICSMLWKFTIPQMRGVQRVRSSTSSVRNGQDQLVDESPCGRKFTVLTDNVKLKGFSMQDWLLCRKILAEFCLSTEYETPAQLRCYCYGPQRPWLLVRLGLSNRLGLAKLPV